MHREIISAFVAPAKYVWEQEFGRRIDVAETESMEFDKTLSGMTLICPVRGTLTGTFAIYLDGGTAKNLSAGMKGRWVANYEDLMKETLATVSKKVTESAKPLLKKIGYECQIGETVVLEGKGHKYPRPEGGEQTYVRMESEFGSIGMILSFIDEKTEEAKRTVAARLTLPEADPAAQPPENGQEAMAPRVELDFDPGTVPEVVRAKRFELVSETGATRAVIGMLKDGSPHVVLADTEGRMRCAVWLAPNGVPYMAFFDDDGRRSWVAA